MPELISLRSTETEIKQNVETVHKGHNEHLKLDFELKDNSKRFWSYVNITRGSSSTQKIL